MNKQKNLSLDNQQFLTAAQDEWQEAKHDRKASKAMRDKRKAGRGKQWQAAV